jgi:hypothetical protein
MSIDSKIANSAVFDGQHFLLMRTGHDPLPLDPEQFAAYLKKKRIGKRAISTLMDKIRKARTIKRMPIRHASQTAHYRRAVSFNDQNNQPWRTP